MSPKGWTEVSTWAFVCAGLLPLALLITLFFSVGSSSSWLTFLCQHVDCPTQWTLSSFHSPREALTLPVSFPWARRPCWREMICSSLCSLPSHTLYWAPSIRQLWLYHVSPPEQSELISFSSHNLLWSSDINFSFSFWAMEMSSVSIADPCLKSMSRNALIHFHNKEKEMCRFFVLYIWQETVNNTEKIYLYSSLNRNFTWIMKQILHLIYI